MRQMSNGIMGVIHQRLRDGYEAMLKVTEDLTEEEFTWRPGQLSTAPSIGFHLWHIARWADRLQGGLPGMTSELSKRLGTRQEVWETEGLASRWGFDSETLGFGETGMGMDDDVSASLPLPSKDVVLDYARRVFAGASQVVDAVDDQQFKEKCIDLYGRESSVGHVVIGTLTHCARHLGMIEALRGVEGLRGTASR